VIGDGAELVMVVSLTHLRFSPPNVEECSHQEVSFHARLHILSCALVYVR